MSSTRNTDLTPITATPQRNTEVPSKSTGHVPFIEKPSKVLKSSSGLLNELKFSCDFHSEGIPLLVSARLLRARDLGQLDLSRIRKDRDGWLIEIGEVKSSEIGAFQMERFQKMRLYAAQKFLSGVFGFSSKLIRLVG